MFKKKEIPMFIGYYKKSVILTYLGILSATIGMYFALNFNPSFAIIFLLISGVCDAFDGRVARACKRTNDEKLFGIELDSLADMVSFIFLPINIFYGLGFSMWYHIIIYALYTLAGVIRLAYFNVKAEETDGPVSYYSGLPVTSVSFIFPLVYLLSLVTSKQEFNIIYTLTMLFISLLFILNFKLKKPDSKLIYAFTIFAFIAIIAFYFISVR